MGWFILELIGSLVACAVIVILGVSVILFVTVTYVMWRETETDE